MKLKNLKRTQLQDIYETMQNREETYKECLKQIQQYTDDKYILALISRCKNDILYNIRRTDETR